MDRYAGNKNKRIFKRTSLLEQLVVHYGQDKQLIQYHEKMSEADKLPSK